MAHRDGWVDWFKPLRYFTYMQDDPPEEGNPKLSDAEEQKRAENAKAARYADEDIVRKTVDKLLGERADVLRKIGDE